jgi:elongation factor G
MDRIGSDYRRCLKQMKDRMGAKPILLQLPIGFEDSFSGIIDLIEMKARVWDEASLGKKFSDVEIPSDLREEAVQGREEMLEALAEVDESIMEQYLEEEEITPKEIRAGIRRAANGLECVPVLLGSAFKNKGVQMLLDGVVDYLPSPLDVPPMLGLDESGETKELVPADDEPFAGLAFKLMNDPYVGHLTFLRVYAGNLKSGSVVFNATKQTKEKIGRLLKMHADKREETKEVYAGDIVAAVGLRNTTTGDTLTAESRPVTLEQLHVPEPVVHVAVEPNSKEDRDKLSLALNKISSEDPSFRVRTDEETEQIIISGMGELHLEIIVDRLLREFKVKADVGAPEVAYRETITRTVEAEGRHVRQTGGRGQYGHVWLRLEPTEPGSGLSYATAVVGGTVPRDYFQAVGKGVEQAASKGVMAGYPVTDLKVTLYDGSYHDVDSSEMAFTIAGSLGLKSGLKKAGSILLEPMMKVEVVTPEEFVGEVMGDLASRRGRVKGLESRSGVKVIEAEVPLATMFGYATELRSNTQGRATYTMQFGQYEPCPESVTAEILSREKHKP